MPGLQLGPEREQDSHLIGKAAKGDSGAWHKLVEKYSSYVYAIIRSTRLPEHEEPDAFQYVFVELFKNLASLTRTDSLAPWLRQTTLRRCVRIREKLARECGPHIESEPADPQRLEEEILKADEAQKVRESVAGLTERCRELVVRLFFSDPPEPYSVVAEALGIKPASIAMTRQRCLEALEKALRSRGVR